MLDVGDEAAVGALVDTVERDIGAIDLFVSNAGVGFGDADGNAASRQGGLVPADDRWEACWNINVMAHVYAARALLPRMIERGGGYLVNVASAAGLLSQIGDAAYSATKHAAVEDDSQELDGGFGGNDVDGILSPDRVADDIVAGIREGRFLVLPHPQVRTYFQRKAADHDRWIAGMQRFRRKLNGERE